MILFWHEYQLVQLPGSGGRQHSRVRSSGRTLGVRRFLGLLAVL